MRRDDFITLSRQGTEIYRAAVQLDDVKPTDAEVTQAGVDITPSMRITLTYTPTLEQVLTDPAAFRFKLDRRPETGDQGVLMVKRSMDRRYVVIMI